MLNASLIFLNLLVNLFLSENCICVIALVVYLVKLRNIALVKNIQFVQRQEKSIPLLIFVDLFCSWHYDFEILQLSMTTIHDRFESLETKIVFGS